MACMDHACRDCGHVWFNNQYREPCPMCGSTHVVHHFDEEPTFCERWEDEEDDRAED